MLSLGTYTDPVSAIFFSVYRGQLNTTKFSITDKKMDNLQNWVTYDVFNICILLIFDQFKQFDQ